MIESLVNAYSILIYSDISYLVADFNTDSLRSYTTSAAQNLKLIYFIIKIL